jgi:hypothetical protein
VQIRDAGAPGCVVILNAALDLSVPVDAIPPVAACRDITVQLDGSGNVSITTLDIDNGSSDNCGLASMSLNITDFTCADIGGNIVTLTVLDGNGNSDNCSATVTVEDNIAPTFSIPADLIIFSDAFCNYDASIGVTGDVTDEADNCSVGDATFVDAVDNSDVCNIVISRTWSLVDDNGNSAADQVQTITVQDNIAPVFSACPANINVQADTSYCGVDVSWTAPTASDNCSSVLLTSTHAPGDYFPVGTTTVTYTATDACGNMSVCNFDVIVGAATPPVINGPIAVCTPSQGTYTVTDPGSHTFLWTVTNGTISGSDANSSVNIDWTGTTQGTVTVTITSGTGCDAADVINVDKTATLVTGEINSSNSLTRR